MSHVIFYCTYSQQPSETHHVRFHRVLILRTLGTRGILQRKMSPVKQGNTKYTGEHVQYFGTQYHFSTVSIIFAEIKITPFIIPSRPDEQDYQNYRLNLHMLSISIRQQKRTSVLIYSQADTLQNTEDSSFRIFPNFWSHINRKQNSQRKS